MDYLRRSERVSRMDKVRNETIRTKMGMTEDILQKIEQQLRWYGHVMRMEDCRIARQVAERNPQGKMRRGKVSTWKDGIRDNAQRRNLIDEECVDRELWREKIFGVEENCVFTEPYIHTFNIETCKTHQQYSKDGDESYKRNGFVVFLYCNFTGKSNTIIVHVMMTLLT
jgi:hypothetical protein